MRELVSKLDLLEASSGEIERDETVEFFLRTLREKMGADSSSKLLAARLTDSLAAVDFAALPLNLRARYKESLGSLKNLLAGNPAGEPDAVSPTAIALLALIDGGVLERP